MSTYAATSDVAELQRQLVDLTRRVDDLQALVRRSQVEICRRLATRDPAAGDPAAGDAAGDDAHRPAAIRDVRAEDYQRLVGRVRAAVRAAVPAGAVVAVISRGDDALVELPDRTGWHFPRVHDGRYAGHHPAGDDDAIECLEAVRRAGAGYLVIPATSRWWLDHYHGFRRHLETTAGLVARRDDTCVIFTLQ